MSKQLMLSVLVNAMFRGREMTIGVHVHLLQVEKLVDQIQNTAPVLVEWRHQGHIAQLVEVVEVRIFHIVENALVGGAIVGSIVAMYAVRVIVELQSPVAVQLGSLREDAGPADVP